jgi:magnesium-transporting ATPase (P-type)
MYNRKQKYVKKSTSKYFGSDAVEENNHKEHPDPFLLSNSKILTGSGKAVVCCVGKSTKLSRLSN